MSQIKYQPIVNEYAGQYNVPVEIVNAVITRESGWKPFAIGGAGEIGLMQILPATGRGLGIKNPYDPRQNIEGGVRFLSDLYKKYGNWRDALSHYNGGFNLNNGRKYADAVLAAAGIPQITDRLGNDMLRPAGDGEVASSRYGVLDVITGKPLRDTLFGVDGEKISGLLQSAGIWILAILLIGLGLWKLIK